MNEETLKIIATQLRQPNGEYGIKVGEKMNEGNLHINLYTIEALKPATGDNILEIGMGNGYFVKDILSGEKSIKYKGCDFSETMVNEARKHNEAFITSGQAEFYLADAAKLPFEDETFDKVFSVNTIYFWDNLQLVFSEIRRVLKPQGLITLSVRPKSVMENYPFVKHGFALFTKKDLEDLLSRNNFKVTNTLEKQEPEIEINGEKTKAETLIISGEKGMN